MCVDLHFTLAVHEPRDNFPILPLHVTVSYCIQSLVTTTISGSLEQKRRSPSVTSLAVVHKPYYLGIGKSVQEVFLTFLRFTIKAL